MSAVELEQLKKWIDESGQASRRPKQTLSFQLVLFLVLGAEIVLARNDFNYRINFTNRGDVQYRELASY